MKINRKTYESVFIDYLDGNLSDEDLRSLVDFLDVNPDLEQELKDLTTFSKQNDNNESVQNRFDSEELFRTSIFSEKETNFEELCISFYEGLLNEKEEQYLLELSESREDLLLTFEAYGRTKLEADSSIVFPNKSSLKKHKKIVWHQYVSYAASIIFVLGFVFYIQGEKSTQFKNEPIQYSEIKESKTNFPKEESVKSYAYSENVGEEVEEIASNNQGIRKDNTVKIARKVTPVKYNQEYLEDFEQNSPLSYSRKGKLAYSNLSELEQYLSGVFEEKNIDNVSVQDEISTKEVSKKKDSPFLKNYNKIQIATSLDDPYLFQKRILGSQPVE